MQLLVLDANSFWTERLFTECARFADVLLLKPREIRDYWRRRRRVLGDRSPRQLSEGVWEQRLSMPPRWLFELWPIGRWYLSRVLCQFKRRAEASVLVFSFPQYWDLVHRVAPALSLYYNTDDYSDHWRHPNRPVDEVEARAVQVADITICIAKHRAEVLAKQFPERARHIYHLPIGCSPELMVEDVQFDRPNLPNPLLDLGRPLIGYVGALNWRFDYRFLIRVARQLPDVNFVLGGRIPIPADGNEGWWLDVVEARGLSNVHWIGWVPHGELKQYLCSFDALFATYARCRFNTNSCPAKLWDYLGTSLPIVANSAVPEINNWQGVVRVADTPVGFAQEIMWALEQDTLADKRRRLGVARAHTWNRLSQRLHSILQTELQCGEDGVSPISLSPPGGTRRGVWKPADGFACI